LRMSRESPENSEDLLPRKDRAEKLRRKRERMKKHGKNLGKIYLDAIRKRLRGK
jgi:hypothetical protein